MAERLLPVDDGDAFVERRERQVFRISPEFIGHAVGEGLRVVDRNSVSRGDDDFAPPYAIRMIRVFQS